MQCTAQLSLLWRIKFMSLYNEMIVSALHEVQIDRSKPRQWTLNYRHHVTAALSQRRKLLTVIGQAVRKVRK
jgi:hypothetical protein